MPHSPHSTPPPRALFFANFLLHSTPPTVPHLTAPRRQLRADLQTPGQMGAGSKWKLKEGSGFRVLATVSGGRTKWGLRNITPIILAPFSPNSRPTARETLVRSLRKSPQTASTVPIPPSPLGQGGGCGDRRKYSWSSPAESQGRTGWQNPGVSPHRAPRLPKPGQRPPARSAPSAGTTLALTFPGSAGRGQSGVQRTFQVRGCGARGSALRWVSTRKPVTSSKRVRSLGRAPHSCVREAACPLEGGTPQRHRQTCESRFPPLHPEQGTETRDPSTPRRPSPDQRGARLQVSPRLCGRWARRRSSPLSLDPTHRPSRTYLSWRCTHRTIQLKSHPLASLPRVPAKRGA